MRYSSNVVLVFGADECCCGFVDSVGGCSTVEVEIEVGEQVVIESVGVGLIFIVGGT